MENNATMTKENQDIITGIMGVEPIYINSNLLTAQERKGVDMGITRTVTTRVHCDVCGEWVTGWESEGIGISREWAKYFVRLQGCTAGKRIICKECRIKQRIKKCSLQKKYGVAGMDGGACLGFSYDGDDEPIERCKRCIACTSFDWEEEKERLKL